MVSKQKKKSKHANKEEDVKIPMVFLEHERRLIEHEYKMLKRALLLNKKRKVKYVV